MWGLSSRVVVLRTCCAPRNHWRDAHGQARCVGESELDIAVASGMPPNEKTLVRLLHGSAVGAIKCQATNFVSFSTKVS